MRDIVFTAVILGAIPFIFRRAWVGVVVLAWLGYMNAQRLCFGFAEYFPFFLIVIICTVLATAASREPKRIPWVPPVWCLLGLILWMNVSYLFALNPEGAWWEWNRTMKTMVFIFLCIVVVRDRQRLELLLWTITLSFGFYGVKGGLFTLLRGGANRVVGPANTFIGDNNQLAVALAMALPLMRYLQLQVKNRRLRMGLTIMMVLTSFAILGTYSRAGFISLAVVGLVMWIKSRRKLLLAALIPVTGVVLLTFMPSQWSDRMNTIKSYDADASTQGRFNAWHFAYNLANDRPLTGGGFDTFTPELFRKYAPEPDNYHVAHSIYFQMLGDNGYPGLLLFMSFLAATWMSGNWVRKHSRHREDLTWAADMVAMLQTSLAVYMVGGATLSLAYFDLPYQLATMIVMCREIASCQMRQPATYFEECESQPSAEPHALIVSAYEK